MAANAVFSPSPTSLFPRLDLYRLYVEEVPFPSDRMWAPSSDEMS
jgi:hypothetical protein